MALRTCWTGMIISLLFGVSVDAQRVVEFSTDDPGGGDIGLYNDNQRGAFTNQDGSGGIDIRDLGPDGLTDDSEVTRKRAGLLQFDLDGLNPKQITAVDLELFFLQGSTNAEIDIYGVHDSDDVLGLAGDGSPGFNPTDPDFHFANSGLFRYYEHEDALLPFDVPPIPDDDDVVNGDLYDSTLDLDMSKVELLATQAEDGDGEADGIISVLSEDTPELLQFVRKDTNGKVLFLLMPLSGQAVTLTNGANGAAGSLVVRFDESVTPGDFDGDGDFDSDDVNSLIGGIVDMDTAFDLTGDNVVDGSDLSFWVKEIKETWIGDANLDGEFNSSDLVQVFTAGKYEQRVQSGWGEGDWNGDGRFNSGDLVAAFTDGGYEAGSRVPANAVPEPTGASLVLAAVLSLTLRRQRTS